MEYKEGKKSLMESKPDPNGRGTCGGLAHPESYRGQQWRKVKQFTGTPQMSDFCLETKILPEPKKGEILVSAISWSLMLYQMDKDIPLGSVMIGEQLARVSCSKHPDFPTNCLVVTALGWRSKAVLDPEMTYCRRIPDGFGGLPPLLCMSTLGLTGTMLYFGFLEVCKPEEDELVLVNSCLGFEAELITQMAKIKGCTVIVFTSSGARTEWVKKLGADHVYNYRRVNPGAVLERIAPQGVDIYVDTMGAKFTESILRFLRPTTRTVVFGYNSKAVQAESRPDPYRFCSQVNLIFRSHSVFDFSDQFDEATNNLLEWHMGNKIRYRLNTDQTLGFSRLPRALNYLQEETTIGMVHVLAHRYTNVTNSWNSIDIPRSSGSLRVDAGFKKFSPHPSQPFNRQSSQQDEKSSTGTKDTFTSVSSPLDIYTNF